MSNITLCASSAHDWQLTGTILMNSGINQNVVLREGLDIYNFASGHEAKANPCFVAFLPNLGYELTLKHYYTILLSYSCFVLGIYNN